jgi:hypothetical protein
MQTEHSLFRQEFKGAMQLVNQTVARLDEHDSVITETKLALKNLVAQEVC